MVCVCVCVLQEHEADERAVDQAREDARRQIIEEERQRLLKQHATKLLGYLPKVRPSDLPIVIHGQEVCRPKRWESLGILLFNSVIVEFGLNEMTILCYTVVLLHFERCFTL